MLNKEVVDVSFAQGLDTKTDPFRVQPGKFLTLQNSIFDKAGRLTKRNGYQMLTTLPDRTSKYVTTFNNNLTALGTSLQAYSSSNEGWINKGAIMPVSLTTLPAVRGSTYQGQADSVTAPNGLTCIAYTDFIPSGGTVTPSYKYAVIDSTTGQNIVAPTVIATADVTYGTPKIFLLDSYFVILFTSHPNTYHLQYIAISSNNPTIVTTPKDIASSYEPATTVAFDGIVVGNSLYVAYSTNAGGQSIQVTYITSTLGSPVTPHTFAGQIGVVFSLTADLTVLPSPTVWISYYDSSSTTGFVAAVNTSLSVILSPTQFTIGSSIANITAIAQNSSVTIFYEVNNSYSYSGVPTHFIAQVPVTQLGVVGSPNIVDRSVGLASKAFLYKGIIFFLAVYSTAYQPTYFLLNSTGKVISQLAYSNAGPYSTLGLANVTLVGSILRVSYLFKDLIQAVNKTQGIANSAGVYSQLGVNIATYNLAPAQIVTSEIGNNLNYTGGFISMYDGITPTEQGFFLYPDDVETVPHTSGGFLSAQEYFYQVTYEWIDNQGNLFRSAPSLPIMATTTTGVSSVTLDIPTLRLTYKIANPVTIVIYRWSQAQQNYYQVTSLTAPLLNDPTVDFVTFVDTLSDASILGNNLIYTTGGVIEDIGPPASDIITLFNNRLWLVDSEDRNLLWFSKQVIEATPVEMSDLLTLYVAPTTASEGSTGPMTALSPMDDKLIVFKANALGYINGIGPDNTGANNQYSDFTLINSVVGCTQQLSIVFMPQGLMFQSNKGIWLLGRDLSTTYIGAPVETLTTGATVLSAVNIPETNQVRFTLDTGITLLYDYYFGQWGTFTNVPAISSTIFQGLHTFINAFGQVFQESPGLYLDGSTPVNMSFTTGWMNLAGVQGFERFYQMYLLGQYISPFNLNIQIAYDYNSSPAQQTTVSPSQTPQTWGSDALWGSGSSWGSEGGDGWEGQVNVFEARVFPQRQKCESFQITATEVFDASFGGTLAGAGLTLTGMSLVIGMKRGFRTSKASRNFG